MTDMTAADYLRAARYRIAAPDRWTKGALARDPLGRIVEPDDPAACQWCAAGAYDAARPLGADDVLHRRVLEIGFRHLPGFNDAPETTHADVLALYDDAIQAAEKDRA
jgi:hypothetical protein